MSSLLTFGLGYPAHLMLTFGLGDSGTAPVTPGIYRDDAVMEDAGERLLALGVFDDIYIGASPIEQPAPASAAFAVAWLWVQHAEDVPIFTGSTFCERKGLFGLAVEVRDQNPRERYRRLSYIESKSKNAIQGKSLANACYPGTVKVERQGRDLTVNHPSVRSVLIGHYRFPVGGAAAADDSDRESVWN